MESSENAPPSQPVQPGLFEPDSRKPLRTDHGGQEMRKPGCSEPALKLSAHKQHRAVRVSHHFQALAAQQQPGQLSQPAGAHDDQFNLADHGDV